MTIARAAAWLTAAVMGGAFLVASGQAVSGPPEPTAAPSSAPPADPAPERPTAGAPGSGDALRGWKSLTLKAESAPLYTGSATLEISEGKHAASGRAAVIFTTRSEGRLLGTVGFEERTTSWIDAEARRPIELFHLRPGESARRLRFEPGRVVQTSWAPPSGRPAAPFEQWPEQETTSRQAVFSGGAPVPPGEWITDPYALLYLLRDIDPAAPAPREYLVWKRRHAIRLRVTPGGRRSRTRSVTDEAREEVVSLGLTERRLDLTPYGEEGTDVRGLMGMQGGLEVWIDEPTGAVLELRGTIPALGPASASLSSFRR